VVAPSRARVARDEYRTVRTARNRYKIAQAEQDVLYTKRVGVVGLSVGNSAAVTFALEGIGGAFTLADFDLLSLSNMNRLRSGAPDIGVNKTVLAAREMLEIDPYLDITRFPRGVKFSGDKTVSGDIVVRQLGDCVTITASNVAVPAQAESLRATVDRINDGDPEALFAERLAHPPEVGGAGIGLIMLRKDYDAKMRVRMSPESGRPDLVRVAIEVTLDNREVQPA
jgi:hypothetical protein